MKTGVILALLAGPYALLVFGSTSLLVTMLAVFALAQGLALVGCNIMHDGAHGSYAHSKTINWLMGGMLNVLGGSQRLWRHKHNRLQHVYAFAMYSLLTLSWMTVGDWRKLVSGHIGPYKLPTPTVADVGVFV